MQGDRFYWRRGLAPNPEKFEDWRRVNLDQLPAFKNLLSNVQNFYLMAITDDEERPSQLDTLRLFGSHRESLNDIGERVFWLSFHDIAGLMEEVPA